MYRNILVRTCIDFIKFSVKLGLKAARGESEKKGEEGEQASVEDELEAELKALKQPKDKKAEAFNSYDTGCKVRLHSYMTIDLQSPSNAYSLVRVLHRHGCNRSVCSC